MEPGPTSLWQRLRIPAVIAAALAIWAAVAEGEDALRNLTSIRQWWRGDTLLIGTWRSDGEGNVDAADQLPNLRDDQFIWLNIQRDETGELQGSMHSPRFCKFVPWNFLLLEVKSNLRWTIFEVFDYIDGKRTTFAYFDVSIDRNGLMSLKPMQVGAALVYREYKLMKASNNPDDLPFGVPQVCPWLMEMLQKEKADKPTQPHTTSPDQASPGTSSSPPP